ncbi:MAG: type II secretion system minor pseudopilin GspJ [Gammaproteobacteria bacterium]|nr:type II secretion system minor pseudopilin GspJ [Gammaproteobacteria bacterium]
MRANHFKQNGFTLLEILVAASIFSIMSIVAITGIKSVLDSQKQTDRVANLIKSLQNTLFYLEQDIQYISNRSIRDEYGDVQTAVKAGNDGLQGLSLTRGGLRNPQGLKRSSLVRVHYWLDDNILMRSQFKSLDRGPDREVINRQLIDQVDDIEFRFLNNKNEWVNFWPQPGSQTTSPAALPIAMEITLTHNKLGKIKRLFAIPN